MYTANAIAQYFINKSTPGTNESVTNLKLQKLLYYAQGFYRAQKGNDLFLDPIEAWVHGPVVPNVYRKYSGYKYHDIEDINPVEILEKDKVFLNWIWDTFKGFSGKDLERITHQEEPWLNARRGYQPHHYSNTPIEPEIIADYLAREYLVSD